MPRPQRAASRPDASMALLSTIMEHSLDAGYAEAAARRGTKPRRGLPAGRGWRARALLGVGLLLAAGLVTLGAAQHQAKAPAAAKERAELVSRIKSGNASADRLQRQVTTLRHQLDTARAKALPWHAPGAAELKKLSLAVGETAVSGPGLKLVVDDAATAITRGAGNDEPRLTDGFADPGRVRDRDLQQVVNGLWAAGAEAISINGQRLTAMSAIRAAGDAILVDNQPLEPPYTLLAIGPKSIVAAFKADTGGQYLDILHQNDGVQVHQKYVSKALKLPAAANLTLRRAAAVPGENASPSGTSGRGTTS